MKRFGLIVALLVGLLSVTLQPVKAAACETVTVFGDDNPKDTGITVNLGDTVSVGSASGLWGYNDDGPIYGADGQGITDGGSTIPLANVMALIGKVGGGSWQVLGSSGNIVADDTGTLYLEGNDAPGAFYNNSGSITIEVCVESGGGGGFTRPLAAADEHPDWGIFDYSLAHSLDPLYDSNVVVNAYSTTFGANVAAVADGTVISVTPFTPTDCETMIAILPNLSFGLGNLRWCGVIVPGPLNEDGFPQIHALEMIDNWRVVVEDAIDPDVTYEYILHSPTVEVGDEVAAGCILGQTIQIKQIEFGILQIAISIASVGLSGGGGLLK